jgi:hypothetical protein
MWRLTDDSHLSAWDISRGEREKYEEAHRVIIVWVEKDCLWSEPTQCCNANMAIVRVLEDHTVKEELSYQDH